MSGVLCVEVDEATEKAPVIGAKLAASSSPASKGSSHTARNVGIGLGGAALLLIGLGGGFAVGRRRTKVSSVV